MERQPSEVTIPSLKLGGSYAAPEPGAGVVVFAHGSGSSRRSPRNRFVAEGVRHAGLGTLLFDLLREEEAADRRKVFDIPLLAGRLLGATDSLASPTGPAGALPVGYFGASDRRGGGAGGGRGAPRGGARRGLRGGRPDLAGPQVLRRVRGRRARGRGRGMRLAGRRRWCRPTRARCAKPRRRRRLAAS